MRGISRIRGLESVKSRLYRTIVSCRKRGVPFPPVLISGLGGCGKSLLAEVIAEELNYHLVVIEAAAFKSRESLIHRLLEASKAATGLHRTLLFFIDECHRLTIEMQEALFYPLEEHRITTRHGDISFPAFCLVAATTRPQLLDQGSFVTRMDRGLKLQIGRYPIESIEEILMGLFSDMGLIYNSEVLRSVSNRCLGIPRNARNLAEKIRDQVLFRGGSNSITKEDICEVIELEGLDEIGLNEQQVELLKILFEAHGVPRGRGLLAAKLNISETAVEEVIEPILLCLGLIDHTSRGRILTESGYKHLAGQGMI